jgi:sporulation protein YlmC with PRC-barrel domain
MNKHTFVALTVASALGLSPFAGSAFGDEIKAPHRKDIKPATLSYPSTPNRTDATQLIGHAVEDIRGNKVGEIEGIHIGKDGKVVDVVVGIGGFLGVGERDVLVKWPSLRIVKDGDGAGGVDKIVVSATQEDLRSMTAYRFDRPDQRRTVFDAPM